MKKSFILHNDSLDVVAELTTEQKAELFQAIIDYNKGIEPELKGLMKAVFIPFRNQFVRDQEAYENRSETNSSNGKKGGRPKKANGFSENPNKPNGFSENQIKAKKAYNDSDNDNDNVNDNVNDSAKAERISTISSFYKNRDLLIRQAQEKYPDKDCAGDFDRMYEQAQIKGYKYKDWKLAYFKWVRNENGFSRPAQQPQITDEGAKWKAKLAELKSRQTVIEVTFSPTVPTYKILEYHNGKGMAYIAGVQRELDNWLATHWELIPLVKEVQL